MADLAQLAIVVDSTSVKGATSDLQGMTTAAGGAEASTKRIELSQLGMGRAVVQTKEQLDLAREGTAKFVEQQDKFYGSLKKSADTMGMSKSQIAAYNAQLLDLGDNPGVRKYIDQLAAAETASGKLASMIEGRLLLTLMRTGGYFLVVTVGIKGLISVVEMLAGASDHLDKSLREMAVAQATNAEKASSLTEQLLKETDAFNTSFDSVSKNAIETGKLHAIRQQIAALGPEYSAIINNENLSLKEQTEQIRALNEQARQQLYQQAQQLILKGPDTSTWDNIKRGIASTIEIMTIANRTSSGLGMSISNSLMMDSQAGDNEAITNWKKQITDLREQAAKLEIPSSFVSALQHTTDKLNQQTQALGKTNGQLIYMKALEQGATESEAQALKAKQDAIDAYKREHTEVGKSVKLKEHLIQLLETEVATQHKITSDAVAYQLSKQNLNAADKARIDVLIEQDRSTRQQEDAQKQLDQEFENGNRLAKERDELENRLLVTHEKYLASLREEADPAFQAGIDERKAMEGLSEVLKKNQISAEQYDKAIIKIKADYVRLKAQGDETLGAIVDAMDIASQRMGEAFGRFVTGAKVNFRDLISSILADIARAEANKLFAKLVDIGISYFAGSSGGDYSGGDSGGVGSVGSGASGVSSGVSSISGLAAPPSGGSYAPQVVANTVVHVSSDGTKSETSTASDQKAQDLSQKIKSAVVQVLLDEQRPGGVLNAR